MPVRSVMMVSGATQFARTPSGPAWRATPLVSSSTPALAAAYRSGNALSACARQPRRSSRCFLGHAASSLAAPPPPAGTSRSGSARPRRRSPRRASPRPTVAGSVTHLRWPRGRRCRRIPPPPRARLLRPVPRRSGHRQPHGTYRRRPRSPRTQPPTPGVPSVHAHRSPVAREVDRDHAADATRRAGDKHMPTRELRAERRHPASCARVAVLDRDQLPPSVPALIHIEDSERPDDALALEQAPGAEQATARSEVVRACDFAVHTSSSPARRRPRGGSRSIAARRSGTPWVPRSGSPHPAAPTLRSPLPEVHHLPMRRRSQCR